MPSDVQIANKSLIVLGADEISALSEDAENARKVNGIWEIVRDAVLEEHPWGFATFRTALSKLSDVPVFDFGVYYQKPTDCLRIIETKPKSAIWKFENEDRIASDTDPLYVRYIKRVTDTSKWSAGFVRAFSSKLAAELAYPITNSRTFARDLMDKYENIDLPKAKAMDSQQGTEQKFDDEDDWIIARY